MKRALILAGATLAALIATQVYGVIIVLLDDEFDDGRVVRAISSNAEVQILGQELRKFEERLLLLKERDFLAVFGKPTTKPIKTYAMPCCQARSLGLSGIRYAEAKMNKDHTDFHQIGDFAAIEVWYQINGKTPAAIVFYFRVNAGFTKLTAEKVLKQRLAWDKEAFQKMVRWFKERRREVYEWEVDEEAESELYQGDHSPDFKEKLASWIETGKKFGYRMVAEPEMGDARPEWRWYDKDGILVRQARHDRGFKGKEALPSEFIYYYRNGKQARDEGGWPHVDRLLWRRQNAGLIRTESAAMTRGRWRPYSWSWYNSSGEWIRSEIDENGDGIPELLKTPATAKEGGKPLLTRNAWAAHPELIPEECRIADQKERRVPVRRISKP